ncbi:co-chaperone YbbN [Planomonospora parontospora subsp. parontospora]|uniref:Co-chaperone YbbN n=2 Tax=Planomonospora parontospora TaxID=58119 RepID=A0AA37F5M5_9ACTN|nr:tetratricopeptide repeat protein [Planomonospora parontospora]GGK74211.1 co-chaperone YbbN [Planomonospora parontospora]GGL35859.1 co-chaperone YbbN [Planomonospora parontospora subsp. antibiotica]GII09600.1 co-chaperone YbbN [Planomonospora parontospora subsp. parontospora]GII17429.1 co-chaperone YbbN [Planomonospora parontospora subsp. antibiotica]
MSPADFTPRPGSLYGAVDLGARKQALEAQARRETTAQQTGGVPAQVIDVDDASFATEVVERSMNSLVLLELTVTRAEQARDYSLLLEKLAAENAGRWVLARVDVEVSRQIAQALRVQNVPALYAIFQGQPVAVVPGIATEPQLRDWLTQLMEALAQYLPPPAEGQEGEPASQEPPVDPDVLAAEQAIDAGDLDGATAAYERLLARSPNNEDAKLGLAGLGLIRRTTGVDPADVERRLADPADVAAQLLAADFEMLSGEVDAAFDRLVGVVRRTSGDDRDKARVHLLGLFETLPGDDPSVVKARRNLASALF